MNINDKRNKLKKHNTKTYRRRSISQIRNIAIHHSATLSGSAESFARYHVNQLDWPGIGYHYVVNQDGSVDLCHDHEVVSYHVGNSNGRTIGICMVGDFRSQPLEDVQRNATLDLTKTLLKRFNLKVDDVWGHMEFPGYSWKPCPSISMEQFRAFLTKSDGLASQEPVFSDPKKQGNRGVLSRGDIGNDVKFLQQKLKGLGFDPGKIDGIFGQLTTDAVERFQRSARLEVDGVVGPKTMKSLESYKATTKIEQGAPSDEPNEKEDQFLGETRKMLRFIKPMMRGNDVKTVQQKVGALVDGVFGVETERLVMEFQQKQGIKADGIVGPITWKALDQTKKPLYKRLLSYQSPIMRGEDIKQVQQALNIEVDGLYGRNTEKAVRGFQKKAGLHIDGIVGPQTWQRLF